MRIRLFGGLAVDHDGAPVEVTGAMQRALLVRLALDAGTVVGYRALAEDLWGMDAPENPRASLQSLVSRLRPQLPADALVSEPGGYRLAIPRDAVDVLRFQDLVAAGDPQSASEALALWTGEPWAPDSFDWLPRDLHRDRDAARRVAEQPAAATDIPAPLTDLIGRDDELSTVLAQLERGRLVTIIGPGGAGKTRLAVEAARRSRHAVLVELAPVGPEEVWQAILGAVGREFSATVESEQRVIAARDRTLAALGGSERLLVLDNCEHLIDAAATTAHDLLRSLPRLRILATSREPLGVAGESFVPLGPLAPEPAERLFAERVLAARSRALQADEHEAASRIRARLDGLPLALELAAAKARTLSIDEIAAGLDDRFSLLTGGLRTVLPRHQTLRALIDWSWSLLDEGERTLLAAMSVYPGGIASSDAARVASAHGGTLAHFDALVDKSLLYRGGGRYRALETIREYGLERLAESGRLAEQRTAQARWLAEASTAHDEELRSARIHEAISWFDAESDNIASALRFTLAAHLDDETVRLSARNAWYWVIRDRNEEAFAALTAASPLAQARADDEALLIRAVHLITGAFTGLPGEQGPDAIPDDPELQRIMADLREIAVLSCGTQNGLLQVFPTLLTAFADAYFLGEGPRNVRVPAEEPDGMGDWARGMLAVVRAAMAQNRGDIAELGEASARALDCFDRTGDQWGRAIALQMRSEWLALSERLADALEAADESTEIMRGITSRADLQQQEGLAIRLLLKLDRVDEAVARSDRQLAEARESGSGRALVHAILARGGVAAVVGDAATMRDMIEQVGDPEVLWPSVPPQLIAMQKVLLTQAALLDGDLVTAELLVRDAVAAAVASRDNPVMADTAVVVGTVAAAMGNLGDAQRALEVAVTLRGAPDPREPLERALRSALTTERPALESTGRSASFAGAIDELAQILRR